MVRVSESQLLLLVVVVLGTLHAGYCLNCFTCSSKDSEKEDCLKPRKGKTPVKHCDSNVLNLTKIFAQDIEPSFSKLFQVDVRSQDPLLPTNCLKQVTKVGNQEYVFRGCQLAGTDKLNICDKVKKLNKDNLNTSYCSLCNTDVCNASPPAAHLSIGGVLTLLVGYHIC